jgi:RND family efflux transporter MFP subunit
MNSKWIKIVAPIVVLVLGVVGMNVIGASGEEVKEKEKVDTRPTVKIEAVKPLNHQVMITGHGEVKPLETTVLSAQVSGEVVKWHPNFVAGGLVKRGEVLFEIEKDAYQAALMQAQAQLASAQASLIEEQGRADVAAREAKTLPKARVTDLYLRKPQLLSAKAQVKSAQASVKLAKRDLNNTTVVAPFNALVVARDLGVGQFVSTGSRIGQLHNIEVAEVVFPVAGFDSAFLPSDLLGLEANISTEGRYSLSRPGTIIRDLGLIDKATRMNHLVVRVEDPYSMNSQQPKLMFGHYVNVTFAGQELNKVFRLSQDLVTNKSVWIVDDENKLEKKQVEVIREEGDYFLLGSGLHTSDRVVLTMPEYPQVGMEVKIAGLNDVPEQDDNESDDTVIVKAETNNEE